MAGRRTNLALLALLVAAFATGALALAAGTSWGATVVVTHGVAGLAVLVITPWKSVIVRRGLGRKRVLKWASVVFALLIVISIAVGISHSAGLERLLFGLSPMQVHIGAALLALPFLFIHLRTRPAKPRRADLSRRNVIRGLGLVGGGAVLFLAGESISRLTSLPGARRRFTGSHERGSFQPSEMPVTQWLNDTVPSIDANRWRLEVRNGNWERQWTYEQLAQSERQVVATLDCTGGWYAHQEWTGIPLLQLLPANPHGRSIVFTSMTGYSRRLPLRDAETLLVATRVGGTPLSAGHGFPARLVAPGRRGFWWVKWLTSIEVDDRPWWTQLPFPAE
jgi:DMSO/TMAO reductase YedYZ molybdopterin-dependent catalytic subunit